MRTAFIVWIATVVATVAAAADLLAALGKRPGGSAADDR